MESEHISFVAVGVPQPKGSTTAFIPKGWTRPVITSSNKRNKGWERIVADAASEALGDRRDMRIAGPVLVHIDFYLPRPASLKSSVEYHVKKPDLDKLTRSVNDALTASVLVDDSQIVWSASGKHYVSGQSLPGARIRLSPQGSSLFAFVPYVEKPKRAKRKGPGRAKSDPATSLTTTTEIF